MKERLNPWIDKPRIPKTIYESIKDDKQEPKKPIKREKQLLKRK